MPRSVPRLINDLFHPVWTAWIPDDADVDKWLLLPVVADLGDVVEAVASELLERQREHDHGDTEGGKDTR